MNSVEYMNNSHNESAYITLQPCYRMILNVIYAFSRYSNGLTLFNFAIVSLSGSASRRRRDLSLQLYYSSRISTLHYVADMTSAWQAALYHRRVILQTRCYHRHIR
jgi:hypothetical protein